MTLAPWALDDFLPRFDEWVERDDPTEDSMLQVMAWIHGVQSNPYQDAQRSLELGASFWFVDIPGAADPDHAVICSYVVDETNRRVRCSAITTLRRPV